MPTVSCPSFFRAAVHSGVISEAASVGAAAVRPVALSLGVLSVEESPEAVPLLSSAGAQAATGTRTRGSTARPGRRRMGRS